MSKEIKKLYRKEGLKPPDGKGIHTKRAHKAVVQYLKKGMSKEEAWKRVMGGMGRDLVVKKAHRRSPKFTEYQKMRKARPGE